MSMYYWIIEVRQVDNSKPFNPPKTYYYPASKWAKDEALEDAKAVCLPGQMPFCMGKELT